jgi:hypothetical protein
MALNLWDTLYIMYCHCWHWWWSSFCKEGQPHIYLGLLGCDAVSTCSLRRDVLPPCSELNWEVSGSVSTYHSARYHNPEDNHRHLHHREILKSHTRRITVSFVWWKYNHGEETNPGACVTAICCLDLSIVRMFCNHNVSRGGSLLIIRWNLLLGPGDRASHYRWTREEPCLETLGLKKHKDDG